MRNPGYGRGGRSPTVTDANLVLGRLLSRAFLGGGMALDVVAAESAMDGLAAAMQCSRLEAAAGILAIADEHMARGLRTISIQRGEDPAAFTLVSFGGAGGLHVCSLAEKLGMRRAMVPVHGGVLSALGMLAARPGRQLTRTRLELLSGLEPAVLQAAFESMAAEGLAALEEEGQAAEACTLEPSIDLRYQGAVLHPGSGLAGRYRRGRGGVSPAPPGPLRPSHGAAGGTGEPAHGGTWQGPARHP